MAAAVSRMFTNKFSGCRSVLRCIRPNSSQNFNLSTQTQPIISSDEPSEIKLDPLQHPDYFGVSKLFTVEDLFNARVHYGHTEGTLDPRMKTFIYGSRLGHIIFDLDQTAELLREALNFTAHIAYNRGIILFLCRNPQFTHLVEKTAIECGEFSHTRRWRGGIFTNSLNEFQASTRLPDLCIFLNTLNPVALQHRAVSNAAKMCIPTVGIVDSDVNPNLITYPVPGNDDTPIAARLYCKLFKQAILLGKEARSKLETDT
ncbi:hypothetical protein QAD02_022997 [Eretmocerus hayati]|uniref:Uncharacterized protein n=1 Tax=Eretmocerus hayati TaxID=131215 RepID=A0ACC2PUN4_9HYME|nr:hypothetical protein QAD02_022997 [Eretmocerus hayati]